MDGELTLGSGVDELSGVHAFNSDEILSTLLVFVLVSENNFGERGATAGVVHNVLDKTFDVAAQNKERVSRRAKNGKRESLACLKSLTQRARRSRGF